MKTPDQAGEGGVRAQEMRTFGALRAGTPAPGAADRLTDRALRAAAANPDHSEAGRNAAAAALRARSISPTAWRVRAPGFLRPQDVERGDALFSGGARNLLTGFAAFTGAAAIGLLAWRAAAAPGLHMGVIWTAAGLSLVALALSFLASVVRPRPARVCVLGGDDVALRRMLRRELRRFGHVARLDAPDAPMVRTAADYRSLARRMGARVRLNFAATVSRRAPLLVRATPNWRPLVRRLLADSSDAVVIDLSDGADALQTVTVGDVARERCVFVTLWGQIDRAEAALRQAGIDAPCFFYAPDGEMQRRARFRAALLSAMRATHGLLA